MEKTVSDILKTSGPTYYTSVKNLVYYDRAVGLELERETNLSDSDYTDSFRYIRIITDDSLRENGKEIVFKAPLIGSTVLSALKEIGYYFKSTKCTHSYRTSDHIHIDVNDFTKEQLFNFYKNFLIFEATFFNLGKIKFNRQHNSYCIPHWEYNLNNPVITNKVEKLFGLPKYLSMRFHPEYGSIEFRMFESTNSISTILKRINFCLEFVENSKTITVDKADESNLKKIAHRSFKLVERLLQESSNCDTIESIINIPFSNSFRRSKVDKFKESLSPDSPEYLVTTQLKYSPYLEE